MTPMQSKPHSEEYRKFANLLGRVLSVSKADLNRQMEKDKQEKRIAKPTSHIADQNTHKQ